MGSIHIIEEKKIRRSNLELYRIIVMILIVAHHYVVNSGLMDVMANDPMSFRSLYLYFIGMWGKTGINFCTNYRLFHVSFTNNFA